jgi:hypothetical protein
MGILDGLKADTRTDREKKFDAWQEELAHHKRVIDALVERRSAARATLSKFAQYAVTSGTLPAFTLDTRTAALEVATVDAMLPEIDAAYQRLRRKDLSRTPSWKGRKKDPDGGVYVGVPEWIPEADAKKLPRGAEKEGGR